MLKTRLLTWILFAPLTVAHSQSAFAVAAEDVSVSQREASLNQAENLRKNRRYLEALEIYQRLLAVDAQDPDAFRMRAISLSDIGDSFRAWQLYRSRPELFDAQQRERFELDRLARLVAWSRAYSEDEDTQLSEAKDAEIAFTQYLTENNLQLKDAPARLRFDRLILLNRLGNHRQVIDEYQELHGSGLQIPQYTLGAIGDSFLALQQPTSAIALLEAAAAEDSANIDLQIQLAYARLENEQSDLAIAGLKKIQAEQPPWKYVANAKAAHANWARYDIDTTLAMLSAFSEDLPTAEQAMEKLVGIAPANAALQASLGSVYQMRGWPERALERFRIASTLDERNVAARVAQVETLAALGRADLARPMHDELLRKYPGQSSVQRMHRQWISHQGWQGRAFAAGGRSEISSPGSSVSPLGSRDGHYGLEVQSPLLDDRWRLTALVDSRWADFHGQRVRARRHGVGIAYGFDRLQASVGVNRAADAHGGLGLDLRARWRLDDSWTIGLDARRNDYEASLQARAAQITADSFTIGGSHSSSERTEIRASMSQYRYTDGNRRNALSASFEQRVLSKPDLLLGVTGGFYASRASRNDAPYFNPSRDASLEVGLLVDHLVWRNYDRHLRQRLNVSASRYWQQSYGSAWIPIMRYEHDWQIAHGKAFEYGLNLSRPVYDGQREQHLGFDLEFRWGE